MSKEYETSKEAVRNKLLSLILPEGYRIIVSESERYYDLALQDEQADEITFIHRFGFPNAERALNLIDEVLTGFSKSISKSIKRRAAESRKDKFIVPKSQLKPFLTPRQEIGLD